MLLISTYTAMFAYATIDSIICGRKDFAIISAGLMILGFAVLYGGCA